MAASPSEMTQQRLDSEAIAAVDTSDLLTDVVGLPEHLRDAKWKVESAQLSPWDSPGGLIVAGMGGSSIGGLLARAMLGDHASRPILAALAPTACRPGRRPTRPCCAPPTQETRRKRSPATRQPERWAPAAWRSPAAAASRSSRVPTACR